MTKILHSACLLSPSSGMLKQMLWEQRAAEDLNLPWDAVMYCPKNAYHKSIEHIQKLDTSIQHDKNTPTLRKLMNWLRLRRNYYQWLLNQDCDVHLLRYYVHDYWQWQFIRKVKKPVFLVHHALEVAELSLPGHFSAKVRAGLESLIGKKCIAEATGIIGVTQEIADYELSRIDSDKPIFVYPNGYMVREDRQFTKKSEQIEILFVAAQFDPWHGLDLLLKSMQNNHDNFILHLVGLLTPEQQVLVKNDHRIKVYGILEAQEIEKIAEKCWVGLSSFALYRADLNEACTLKVREYLAQGLPVYSGHKDIFPESFEYYQQGSADIRSILDYAQSITCDKKTISTLSSPYIDKKILLSKLYDGVVKQVDKK